ncbi:hypothetical protein Pcinc_017628 [Petrolisthes cinctipes]|uniref:Uncharacterized protein n=1 Tax=Petrolisthes cinctipes TaxID=88211 RepID=A0AAE1FQA3_PETCI|nr:hypothetical protein Pcinc_017628 [Petrolisthes cinctipes]
MELLRVVGCSRSYLCCLPYSHTLYFIVFRRVWLSGKMSFNDIDVASSLNMGPAASPPLLTHPASFLSRKRRMNFFDLANLLDSDGNLQNEMMVFAFAATMLSTIPILLGNEFDVNVGLRKRRLVGPYKDPDQAESTSYISYTEHNPPTFFSGYTYKQLMTSTPGPLLYHVHNNTNKKGSETAFNHHGQTNLPADPSLIQQLENLMQWSAEKVKDKAVLPLLINLALDRYNGNTNPADKLVRSAYKKWVKYWY